MQEGDGIAQLFQVADNVGGNEDGAFFVPGKIQQDIHHFIPHHRVQPIGGFIQQQQLAWWESATAMHSFLCIPAE